MNRAEIVENKRLDAALEMIAEMQEWRELTRNGPRRTGQTDSMSGIPDGSRSNGYKKTGKKPGRRVDFMNDPEVNARRAAALARMEIERLEAAE